jgi:hypothetical protein
MREKNKFVEDLDIDKIEDEFQEQFEKEAEEKIEKGELFAEDDDEKLWEEAKQREKEETDANIHLKKVIETKISVEKTEEAKKKAEETEKLYALDDWMKLFNKISFENEIPGRILYHVLLGTALADKKIYMNNGTFLDYRIHFFFLQSSGSGKGQAFWLMKKMLNSLRIPMVSPIGISHREIHSYKCGNETDASLLDRPEMKKNIDTGNIVSGILSLYDTLYFEEARCLLETGKFNDNIKEILIGIMEPIGSENHGYSKKLRDWTRQIITSSRVSIFASTRPVTTMKENLIWNGLLQRMMFYVRELDGDERQKMLQKASSSAFGSESNSAAIDTEILKVAEKIQKVIDFAASNTITIKPESASELSSFLNSKASSFWNDLKEINTTTISNIVESFIGRYKDLIIKLAYHSAITRRSTKVELCDLEYAYSLLKECYDSQINWIQEKVVETEDEKIISRRQDRIKKELLHFISQQKNKSLTRQEAAKYIASMGYAESYGYAKLIKLKNSGIIDINSEGDIVII